jgi:DNA-binding NarL/FixJ family response regulator
MSEPPIRLVLIDDHLSYRHAVGFMLSREADLRVVAQAGTRAEARAVLRDHGAEIDVALIDLDLPDGSGVGLIHDLRVRNPEAVALVVTGSTSPRDRAFAVEAGATGVLHKSLDVADIAAAVRQARGGESLIPPREIVDLLRAAGRLRTVEQAGRSALARLTDREREVLRELADGRSDKEIAERLGVSAKTARGHVVNLLGKLGVDSRLQAVILAARLGAVDFG